MPIAALSSVLRAATVPHARPAAARDLRSWLRRAWAVGLLALAGCAGLPPPVERPDTHALPAEGTALGRLVHEAAPDPERSGLRPLINGAEAFDALAALIDRAERSLDLQYYLVRGDDSSCALLQRVRSAAVERGVRVRLLVDDLNTAGEEELLLALARVPGIEVRLYNPLPAGRFSTLTRVLASLTELPRVNRRMHNKMLVADNAVAVTGGRNLGDAYFLRSPSSNFVDLDVLAAGPVVRLLSTAFDRYWNDPLAYPVQALAGAPAAAASGPSSLDAPVPDAVHGRLAGNAWTADLVAGRLPALEWAPVRLLVDPPSKIGDAAAGGNPAPGPEQTLADDLIGLVRTARSEVIVISPYFVPGPRGMAVVRELHAHGVALRVLTNSLASTDAPAVHIGYSRYRAALLENGVELHELRRQLGQPQAGLGDYGSSNASLHSKALVIDRRIAVIGSMNMDPRSARLNTELGLVIRSDDIAEQLAALYEDVSASSAWRVTLGADGEPSWETTQPEPRSHRGGEPDAAIWLQLALRLLAPFAPEEML